MFTRRSCPGAGGMPVGTGGRAALLISGGIDSPVAGYMMAKRGIELTLRAFRLPALYQRAGGDEGGLPS